MEIVKNLLGKLKDKKTWVPLVGSAALAFAAYTGTPVSEGAQSTAVDAITTLFTSVEGVLAAGAGVLGVVGLWNAGQSK